MEFTLTKENIRKVIDPLKGLPLSEKKAVGAKSGFSDFHLTIYSCHLSGEASDEEAYCRVTAPTGDPSLEEVEAASK